MTTHKHIDRICVAVLAFTLLLSVLFLNADGLSVQAKEMGYEARLFDTSKVHTIDIIIDDWDAFLQTCQSETYSMCSVVIDGEAFQNIGIRGKGNTSLSTVASMDSDRYSFKLEFDQYASENSYYGLDKLSLNNLIQDNTMMKDYLTYQMMLEFGADAPLCSYVNISVNGEAWGLYLAVEAVEESFLQRNYGSNYGELYKPDSMEMGGGRGNGKNFDPSAQTSTENGEQPSMPEGFDPSQMGGMMPGGNGEQPSMPESFDPSQMGGMMPGAGMSNGASDVKLQYIDDQAESYSTIFDSAKTNITAADQKRLIESLKQLNSFENIDAAVDTEAVMRYFVVHNYVVNADSYTGSMVHNYYLYEKDGRLSMIPWDYNLAFGTFQGNNANSAVNDDIDAPLSVNLNGDRPMIEWIYRNEEYTTQYHQYFKEFIDTVDADKIIDSAYTLIAPYVESDLTKFCTVEEFELGVETLRVFCQKRTEAVTAQLSGNDTAIDASSIDLSAMGTMNQRNMSAPTFSRDEAATGETFSQSETAPNMNRNQMKDRFAESSAEANSQGTIWLLAGISVLVLCVGLLFAFKFKK